MDIRVFLNPFQILLGPNTSLTQKQVDPDLIEVRVQQKQGLSWGYLLPPPPPWKVPDPSGGGGAGRIPPPISGIWPKSPFCHHGKEIISPYRRQRNFDEMSKVQVNTGPTPPEKNSLFGQHSHPTTLPIASHQTQGRCTRFHRGSYPAPECPRWPGSSPT